MKQNIQITIPEPCQEGWQNMTPVEKGKFCASCQKTVLDFTHLSDNEIIKLVSKNDTLCGRINISQLNRNLIETKTKSNYFGYFATSVLAFLGIGTESVAAQEKPILEQTDFKYLNKVSDSLKKISVTGIIKDSIGTLPGVIIEIKNTTIHTVSDEVGKYFIEANIGDTLVFTYLGYTTTEMTIKSNNLNVQLVKENREIVVMVGFIKKRTFFGRTFRKIGNWFR